MGYCIGMKGRSVSVTHNKSTWERKNMYNVFYAHKSMYCVQNYICNTHKYSFITTVPSLGEVTAKSRAVACELNVKVIHKRGIGYLLPGLSECNKPCVHRFYLLFFYWVSFWLSYILSTHSETPLCLSHYMILHNWLLLHLCLFTRCK